MDVEPAVERTQQNLNALIAALPNVLIAIVVFAVFFFVAGMLKRGVQAAVIRARRSTSAALVIGRIAQWAVLLVGLLAALSVVLPSFQPAQIIELLGISSVAIGFAFRDILQNFLAGILLLLTEPFRIGDQIIVGDYEGTVDDIHTRATYIRTYDGRRVVIPNGVLFNESVIVNTAFENRRTDCDIGIGYGDDIDLARQLILDVLQSLPDVQKEPKPDVLLVRLDDFAMTLRARWWTAPSRLDTLIVQDRVLQAIKVRLNENGIDLPFPTTQVLFHDQTEATDGDRSRQREGWPAGKVNVPEPATLSRTFAATIGKYGKNRDTGQGDR